MIRVFKLYVFEDRNVDFKIHVFILEEIKVVLETDIRYDFGK